VSRDCDEVKAMVALGMIARNGVDHQTNLIVGTLDRRSFVH
jgi:hypothetical protein